MIRVAIAAASPVMKGGLEALVVSTPGMQLTNLEDGAADVVLAAGGFEPPENAAAPIVLLAPDAEALFTLEQFQAGVRAVLPPDASPAAILAAVEAVAGGLAAIDPQELEALLGTGRPALQNAEADATLTPRELEVLRMMAVGAANKTIAWKLGISEHTVKFHVASILSKLGAGTRTEAVTIGIRKGLVMV